MKPAWKWALAALCASGCAVLSSELETATKLYDDAQYEAALRWLDELKAHTADMTPSEQARFHYLRGMTAYRLGQRQDALHFLTLAQVAGNVPGASMQAQRRQILQRTLVELTPDGASPHARAATATADR